MMFTLGGWRAAGVAGLVLASLVVTLTAMQMMAGSFLLTARVRLDILSGLAEILIGRTNSNPCSKITEMGEVNNFST